MICYKELLLKIGCIPYNRIIKTRNRMSVQSKQEHDHLAKILVIGDGGVGKTSLITRFADERFITSYTATIGVDFKSRLITLDDKNIKLQIWDTAGQERFRNITQAYYRGAAGILLAFSLTDLKSFQNIQKWVVQMEENAPKDCCKVLVGTKLDCESERTVNRKDPQNLAIKMGIQYMQSSSKTGQNVQNIFIDLGKMIYQTSLKKKVKNEQNLKIKPETGGIDGKRNCKC